MRRVNAFVVAVLALAGCSSPSMSSAPGIQCHGEATDPIGDTASVADVRVPRPADLVYASFQVTDDGLRLTVRFAPGSLDPTTTGVMLLVDTDLNPETGVRSTDLGAEYAVTLDAGPVREATVARAVNDVDCPSPANPCRFAPFGRAGIVLANDQMETVIPRSAFTPFDGRLNFRVIAYANLDGGRQTVTSDHLPNLPAQFIPVR